MCIVCMVPGIHSDKINIEWWPISSGETEREENSHWIWLANDECIKSNIWLLVSLKWHGARWSRNAYRGKEGEEESAIERKNTIMISCYMA